MKTSRPKSVVAVDIDINSEDRFISHVELYLAEFISATKSSVAAHRLT